GRPVVGASARSAPCVVLAGAPVPWLPPLACGPGAGRPGGLPGGLGLGLGGPAGVHHLPDALLGVGAGVDVEPERGLDAVVSEDLADVGQLAGGWRPGPRWRTGGAASACARP